jgi:hypothetical protein
MKAKTLIQSWLEVEVDRNGKTVAGALRDLNAHLGSSHTHSRVSEWKENRNGRGDRLPRRVRVYMAKIVIKAVLEDGGLKMGSVQKKTLNKIAEQLC